MNRVLAIGRQSQAQLVEARTKAEVQRIEPESTAEAARLQAASTAEANRQQATARATETAVANAQLDPTLLNNSAADCLFSCRTEESRSHFRSGRGY